MTQRLLTVAEALARLPITMSERTFRLLLREARCCRGAGRLMFLTEGDLENFIKWLEQRPPPEPKEPKKRKLPIPKRPRLPLGDATTRVLSLLETSRRLEKAGNKIKWPADGNDIAYLLAMMDGHSVVYFFQIGDAIKIGTTKRPAKRIPDIAQGAPHGRLIGLIAGGYEIEDSLHEQFAEHRIHERREWFRPAPEMRDHIAKAGVLIPWREEQQSA